jgi:hypothetical protein
MCFDRFISTAVKWEEASLNGFFRLITNEPLINAHLSHGRSVAVNISHALLSPATEQNTTSNDNRIDKDYEESTGTGYFSLQA